MDKLKLLDISKLKVEIKDSNRSFFVVRDLDLQVQEGEVLGIVGESGCGKSMTAYSILRILPAQAKITDGNIIFKGVDLLKLSEKEMRKYRGREIGIVFQEPGSALNPVFTIGYQVSEPLLIHFKFSREEARKRAIKVMKEVGLTEDSYNAYPHMLSGGMKQRAVIAMAIAAEPSLVIADEPTTALDVTVEAQILELFKKLQKEKNLTVLFITHNIEIVAEMCTRVAVMYTGQIVEIRKTEDIIKNPLHPYTQALLRSIPHRDKDKLDQIPGNVPPMWELTEGCAFKDRCPERYEKCDEEPQLLRVQDHSCVRCWRRQ